MADFQLTTSFTPVPRFPRYFLDDDGNVWSVCRGRYKRLRPTPDAYGYPTVSLCDGINPPLKRCVHKIVAEVFIGPRPDGLEVRHKDGNRANYHPSNLLYATHAENMADMRQHNTGNRGGTHTAAKLTEEDVLHIRSLRGKMLKQVIADKYGISKNHVTAIWRRLCWKHI